MPYVDRDQDGRIVGIYALAQRDDQEYVDGEVQLQPAKRTADQMWEAIKAERDRRALLGGYMVLVNAVPKWFHSDVVSRTQQIGLILMGANMPASLQWKTMDGSKVTMTPALAQAVFNAAALHDQQMYAIAEQHRAAMLAAPDPDAYDFSGGWPPIYEEQS
jgi:hypothetical protein